MKRLAIEDLEKNVSALVKSVPKEKILLTRNGQPFAFVSDASAYDWEDIGYMTDPKFWEMIRQSRAEGRGVPLEQIEAELAEREKSVRKKPQRKSRAKHGRSAA